MDSIGLQPGYVFSNWTQQAYTPKVFDEWLWTEFANWDKESSRRVK